MMSLHLLLAHLLLALHLIGATAWVGGMLFALAVLRPSLAVLAPPDRLALHLQVFSRFFRLIWHAIPLVLATGYAMVFWVYGGMAGVNGAVHAMQGLGLLMTAIFLAIWFGPFLALRRAMAAKDAARSAEAVARIRRLVTINLALGLLTLVLAGFV